MRAEAADAGAVRPERDQRRGAGSGAVVAVATAAVIAAAGGTAHAEEPVAVPSCPALMVLGVQGTSESSDSAPTQVDSGMLGQVFGPMLARGGDIDRLYIPYPASFGGAVGTGAGTASYADSAARASAKLDATAAAVVAQCPGTRLGVAGFSQGAGVAADFGRRVGAGEGPVPADRVAGVVLLSDPTRPAGPDPIPGRPGQVSPDPAPGTAGPATSQVQLPAVPPTGGIAAEETDFGALTGRVGEICAPGDLACDAPPGTALLQAAAGVAAQSDLRDPLAAAASLATVAQQSAGEARDRVLLDDVTIDAGGQVHYVPQQTVSRRLAEASNPHTPSPGPEVAVAAEGRIAQIGAAVAADPLGTIPRLAGQIGAAIGAELAANAGLSNPATLAGFGAAVASHTGYGANGGAELAADWLAAASDDLSAPR